MAAGPGGQGAANPVSHMTQVLTTGIDPPEAVQLELQYLSFVPYVENRYASCENCEYAVNQTASTTKLEMVYNPSGGFSRARATAIHLDFATNNAGSTNNIQPIPGFGCTFWDQVTIGVGQKQTAVCPLGTQWPKIQMMRWLGDVKKEGDWPKLWWNAAGFFDIKCHDYLGGTSGARSNAANAVAVYDFVGFGYASGFAPAGSRSAPFLNEFTRYAYGNDAQRAFRSRVSEGGRNLDPEAARACAFTFGPNGTPMSGDAREQQAATTQNFSLLVKAPILSSFWDTVTLLPPLMQKFTFHMQQPNAIRPRYIIQPEIQYPAAAGAIVLGPAGGGIPANYGGPQYVQNNCALYVQELSLRSDIHGSVLNIWAASAALTLYTTWWDVMDYQGIVGVDAHCAQLVTNKGTCPYKYALGVTMTNPPSIAPVAPAVGSVRAWPNARFYCPYVFADNNVSAIEFNCTEPTGRRYFHYCYTPYERTTLVDWNARPNMVRRGVLQPRDYWRTQTMLTAGWDKPDFTEIDSVNCQQQWDMDGKGNVFAPPQGPWYSNAAVNPLAHYGSHSCLYNNAGGVNEVQNGGRQDLLYAWLVHTMGYEDYAINYGSYVGGLSATTHYKNKVPYNPVVESYLMWYQNAYYLFGNGMVEQFLKFM